MLWPPLCLYWSALLIILSFATVFGVNRFRKIALEGNKFNFPILRIAIILSIASVSAVVISMVFMSFVSTKIPYLDAVNSEWGSGASNPILSPETVYLLIWTFLAVVVTYAFYSLGVLHFVKKHSKKLIITLYLIEFAVIWLLANGYLYLVLLRE